MAQNQGFRSSISPPQPLGRAGINENGHGTGLAPE
jgi:hypothetical protein